MTTTTRTRRTEMSPQGRDGLAEKLTASMAAGWSLPGGTLAEDVSAFFSFKAPGIHVYADLLKRIAAVDVRLADAFREINRGVRNPVAEGALVAKLAALEAKR